MLSRIGCECVSVTALRTQLGVTAVRGDAAVATGREQQKRGEDWTDTHGQMPLVRMLRFDKRARQWHFGSDDVLRHQPI
jgi:hypothetical protein